MIINRLENFMLNFLFYILLKTNPLIGKWQLHELVLCHNLKKMPTGGYTITLVTETTLSPNYQLILGMTT